MSTSTLLITGGAGFIGSHFTRYWLEHTDENALVFDALTYAGNLANLEDLKDNPRFEFVKGDIRDTEAVESVMGRVQKVIHFAAETHNDRAILDSGDFIQTDVYGTFILLEAARKHQIERFLHISTDEVYGAIAEGLFTEQSNLQPNMPYAASKAGGELMARAYFKTHKLPVLIARAANNFGPNQYPEKMMPLFITNAIDDKPLPMYGDGSQVRDWIYVEDNCAALALILQKGTIGEAYNIGVNGEKRNLEVAKRILSLLGKPEELIRFVTDRPGHDVRYALDASKIRALGFEANFDFDTALERTVQWYALNQDWWRAIKEKQQDYASFMRKWYENR